MDETNSPRVPCPRCSREMRSASVKTAVWREERLFVVEDIPAQVCDSCMEQFYDEETTETLRRLTEEGISCVGAKREILVPIFSLEGQIRKRTSSEEEVYVDY